MADSFDTTEMSNALEAASGPTLKQPIGAPATREEAIAKAREKGWVEPQKYDYSIYNKQEADAGTDTVQSRQHEWASSAGKYEWNDEYGDVGPRVPELEHQLFNDDLRMKRGENFNAFQFQVLVEGPVKPEPVMRVSSRSPRPCIMLMEQSSRTLPSIRLFSRTSSFVNTLIRHLFRPTASLPY